MSAQTFHLPRPPSTNTLYRNVTHDERVRAWRLGNKLPGRLKTERYRTWLNAAGWHVKAARLVPLKGNIKIDILVARKDKRRRDLDNLVKPTQDLLVKHAIIEDDSLIDELHIAWTTSANAKDMVVTISEAA